MNLTITTTTIGQQSQYTIEDHYIPAALSIVFALITIVVSALILVLVWRTKPRLHTVNHLLICNTCVASTLYCAVIINNFIFLLVITWDTNNISCRWRGYFLYAGIAALLYSFFIQGVSRFFFCILSTKYRWLTTFKTHRILIGTKWFVVLIIVLPAVLTNDILYFRTTLCWVPSECRLHTTYTYFAYYVILIILTIIIHIYIFYEIRKTKRNATTVQNSLNRHKRDLECIRNIFILIGIYLIGGIPNVLSDTIMSKLPYLISLVSQVFGILAVNLGIIALDRELRQVIRALVCRTTRVMPINDARPARRI